MSVLFKLFRRSVKAEVDIPTTPVISAGETTPPTGGKTKKGRRRRSPRGPSPKTNNTKDTDIPAVLEITMETTPPQQAPAQSRKRARNGVKPDPDEDSNSQPPLKRAVR